MTGDANAQPERDAEAEFRFRLAAKLEVRGLAGRELEAKIDELLRTGVNLRLDVEGILGHS